MTACSWDSEESEAMIERTTINKEDVTLQVAAFRSGTGTKEYHVMISPEPGRPFDAQLDAVNSALSSLKHELDGAEPAFVRYFLSDASNQEAKVRESAESLDCAVSMMEQPPLTGVKVMAWAYFVGRIEPSAYRHMWHASMTGTGEGSQVQTEDIFARYGTILADKGCSVKENCIRTWLYVQNVDVNYAGVVKGRREFFENIGLTKDTHYIASTGIAGRTADASSKVMMDAYAVDGLMDGQVKYIKGSSHLNPTHEYGVTFERGTSVDYGDRRHVLISGTASIDNKGEIVHPGDVRLQTLRMWENVGVLLDEAGCGFDDIMHMIVYLRDIADRDAVSAMFEERFPAHPKVFVWAPVCRPGWLIEMECMAVKKIDNKEYRPL